MFFDELANAWREFAKMRLRLAGRHDVASQQKHGMAQTGFAEPLADKCGKRVRRFVGQELGKIDFQNALVSTRGMFSKQ